MGLLLLFIHAYELGFGDLASGTVFVGQKFEESVVSGFSLFVSNSYDRTSSVANPFLSESIEVSPSATKVSVPEVAAVYTEFPEITYATTSSTFAEEYHPATISTDARNLIFSDEVTFEEFDGKSGVRPRFKDSDGQLYELSVTAIERVQ